MIASIRAAIDGKKIIRFYYENYLRVVEPYSYGVNSSGDELLKGYQVGGQSKSQRKGWKLFEVDKIQRLTLTDDPFDGKRRDYNPADGDMKIIFCQITKL